MKEPTPPSPGRRRSAGAASVAAARLALAGADPRTAWSFDVQVEPGRSGDVVVLRVAGEIDIFTLPVMQDALTAVMEESPAGLVVDMARVTFCCGRGLSLLASIAQASSGGRTRFAVSGLSPHLDRIMALFWPQQPDVRHPGVDAAVTAINTDRSGVGGSVSPSPAQGAAG